MKYQLFSSVLLTLLIMIGCMQKQTKVTSGPKVNIELPSSSANIVFHIRDNKVSSYEILNDDGTAINEGVVYRRLNETGEKEKCYRCPPNTTDLKNCTEIPCPKDPCKEISCGPLNFQINGVTSSSSEKGTQYTIVTGGAKQ